MKSRQREISRCRLRENGPLAELVKPRATPMEPTRDA